MKDSQSKNYFEVEGTIYAAWKYKEIKTELKKMVSEGLLKKIYPVTKEDKLNREIYTGKMSFVQIKYDNIYKEGNERKDEQRKMEIMAYGNTEEYQRVRGLAEILTGVKNGRKK